MDDHIHCEACDTFIHEDDAERLSGEQINVCPACLKLSRECEYCGRGYLTAEGLAAGCGEEDAMIRQDRNGTWLCDECRADRREASRMEGVNHRIDAAIERKHGHEI